MDFNGGDTNVSVSDLTAQFRAAIARMMTGTFGMDKPARIELEILRSGADFPAVGAEPEADTAEPPAAEAASAPESGQSC